MHVRSMLHAWRTAVSLASALDSQTDSHSGDPKGLLPV
jgi:hypothetical protein